uniref:Uncharacterized protein n=1 Tax=Spongospora subterranea TaxID=70186 RepID=A0A0H5RFB4_9EUKA|eukprot:CRZ07319.1 hypothetical protein [Spongospora subterranea]
MMVSSDRSAWLIATMFMSIVYGASGATNASPNEGLGLGIAIDRPASPTGVIPTSPTEVGTAVERPFGGMSTGSPGLLDVLTQPNTEPPLVRRTRSSRGMLVGTDVEFISRNVRTQSGLNRQLSTRGLPPNDAPDQDNTPADTGSNRPEPTVDDPAPELSSVGDQTSEPSSVEALQGSSDPELRDDSTMGLVQNDDNGSVGDEPASQDTLMGANLDPVSGDELTTGHVQIGVDVSFGDGRDCRETLLESHLEQSTTGQVQSGVASISGDEKKDSRDTGSEAGSDSGNQSTPELVEIHVNGEDRDSRDAESSSEVTSGDLSTTVQGQNDVVGSFDEERNSLGTLVGRNPEPASQDTTVESSDGFDGSPDQALEGDDAKEMGTGSDNLIRQKVQRKVSASQETIPVVIESNDKGKSKLILILVALSSTFLLVVAVYMYFRQRLRFNKLSPAHILAEMEVGERCDSIGQEDQDQNPYSTAIQMRASKGV